MCRFTVSNRLFAAGVALTIVFLTGILRAGEGGRGEGTDLELGGMGDGAGQFLELCDIAFDSANNLYALDGRRLETRDGQKRWVGNLRVQKFDDSGRFISQFTVADESLGENNQPRRLAIDDAGNIYITEPKAGLVRKYGPDGKLLRDFQIPAALAITTRRMNGAEQIVVVANPLNKQNRPQPVQQVELISAAGEMLPPLKLDRPVSNCSDVAADAQGNLYIQADVNQVYKFSATGALMEILGGGVNRRQSDGSELRDTVAVDSRGNVYCWGWNNLLVFDAALHQIRSRPGQFYWYDPWSPHGAYLILAIDRKDRLWVGATGNVPMGVRHHFRPCIMRVREDFLDKAVTLNARALGLDAVVEPLEMPWNLSFELKPVDVELVMRPAHRRVNTLGAEIAVFDVYKNEVLRRRFEWALEDGVESRRKERFEPPRWGWYSVQCRLYEGDTLLKATAAHLGFTPKFAGMPTLAAGESPGGWNDIPRAAAMGLYLHRVNTGMPLKDLTRLIQLAEQYGVTLLVQFESKEACEPQRVKEIVGALKGHVRYWEVVNEPNLNMKAADYAALLKATHALIKKIDPQALVLAPAVCGINLQWIEEFYAAGANRSFDIFSLHDYEGHESIDPGHWTWKFSQLKKIMAGYGDRDKPIWQTERGIPGIRGRTFLGGAQAVRETLHRDLLETLGVSPDRSFYYYLNAGGFGQYPAYLWSAAGPHPGALALRTRAALTRGMNLQGALNFGPSGNRLFMGLQYYGTETSTIILRNLGADPLPVELAVDGGRTLEVIDAFGNAETVPVTGSTVSLKVGTMPTYLRLPLGQRVVPLRMDFGRNLAAGAAISYSGRTSSDMAILTNGVLEVAHPSTPWGKWWMGEWPEGERVFLEITLPVQRTVDRVIVHSMRADNAQSALLDFDVEAELNGQWKTVAQVRTHCPPSDPVEIPESRAHTWYMDQCLAVAQFEPVSTRRLRIVALRGTYGFIPDRAGTEYAAFRPGGGSLHLREIEVYGPPAEIELSASTAAGGRSAPFEKEPVAVQVINRGMKRIEGTVRAVLPEGWTADPPQLAMAVSGGAAARGEIKVTPPLDVAAGTVQLRLDMADRQGGLIDSAVASLLILPPGALRTWSIVGPFPNRNGEGFDAVYEPEKKADPGKPVAFPAGKTHNWKRVNTDDRGFVDLARQFNPNSDVCAYAVAYVKSARTRKAVLSIGADDGCKVWFNGSLVISKNVAVAASPGQYKADVELREGVNEILLKITQIGGGWGFYADLLDERGERIKDVLWSPSR